MSITPARDIIVIGGSAGAIRPLKLILAGLPPDLPAAIFCVQHLPPDCPPDLALSMVTTNGFKADLARDGQSIEYGRVYMAPPIDTC
jgi:two-component system chemotaxis response regulator CheB